MDSLAAPAATGHALPVTIFLAVASIFFSVAVLSSLLKKRRVRSSSSSSSSSRRRIPSPSHGRGYEVFLSFRGPDTRTGFTDSLHLSLKDAGVDVFMDSEELHVGEDIGPELLDRIERLVSIDDNKRVVLRLLEVRKRDVRIIGFFGMGGIGKTTLAKVIYNEIMDDFDSCSFLKDIRETSSHLDGLKRLQSQLAKDLSRREYREFATTDEGTNELQHRFREKKVLVVLDDVDDNNQLEALVSVAWFGPGSRVIVTTRYKNVLSLNPEVLQYEVEGLRLYQSMELFCRHAFRMDSPKAELSDLSLAIVETTGGLPLALEVIGSYLCGKRKGIWEETLKKLEGKPHTKVQENLRISYDSLDSEHKEIFLDIACLFIGEDPGMLIYMWDDCKFYPRTGLDELILRSLVKIGEDGRLWMHDQLRDLGREIVRQKDVKEPGNRSRLWSNEEAITVLKEYKVRIQVRRC
ncbi:hypothetical protein CRG98_040678 [Punica granatum]|uniref:Uncharacterized protein n=1 Tax=Punica granatum TaxID=22663 RepID=A0A2I0I667_PUNGR|nr:hypothetical protein CRG98_040678 [Punica granatum]